jgi:hypothetical protein
VKAPEGEQMAEDSAHEDHLIHFEVDGEELTTTEPVLTPVQIMEIAGIDPANHYISEIRGHEQISYKDRPNAEIPMHNGIKFVSVSTGPTPTS